MNAKLRLKIQQSEEENKDLKIEIKKMTGEIKMLKTVNQQRANFFKKHNELRSVIAEECETQAWRDIVKKERDNMTLKQQIDAQIQKRIVAERRFE